jgi:hypothetical protein
LDVEMIVVDHIMRLKAYDLDRLAYNGYLDKLIDMMENVLTVKTGI